MELCQEGQVELQEKVHDQERGQVLEKDPQGCGNASKPNSKPNLDSAFRKKGGLDDSCGSLSNSGYSMIL